MQALPQLAYVEACLLHGPPGLALETMRATHVCVQDNRFSGSLPVGINNSQLISLRATNNRFNGSIGDDIWKLPLLTTVDLGSNE
jgi:hypothetical protein